MAVLTQKVVKPNCWRKPNKGQTPTTRMAMLTQKVVQPNCWRKPNKEEQANHVHQNGNANTKGRET